MQSYPERPSPLSTTLFISYLVAFCFGGFWYFCGFHQDPHTAVKSNPDHPPPPPPPPSKHIAAKNMTSPTVLT